MAAPLDDAYLPLRELSLAVMHVAGTQPHRSIFHLDSGALLDKKQLEPSDCPPSPVADIQRLNGLHQSSNFRFDNGSFKDKRLLEPFAKYLSTRRRKLDRHRSVDLLERGSNPNRINLGSQSIGITRIAAIDKFHYLTEHASPQQRWHHDHIGPLQIREEVRHLHMQNASRLEDTHCLTQYLLWIGGVFKHIGRIDNI